MQFRLRTLLIALAAHIVAVWLVAGVAFVLLSSVPSNASAVDQPSGSDQKVRDWLVEMPRQPLGEPPRDLSELVSAWIERGKEIPSVESALIRIIRDRSSPQRSKAIFVIGRIGSAKALDAVATVFEVDDLGLQLEAVTAIRAIKSPRRVDVLSVALESTYRQPDLPDKRIPTAKAIVRANIAEALSEIDDKGAEKLLTTLIAKEKDPFVLEVIDLVKSRARK